MATATHAYSEFLVGRDAFEVLNETPGRLQALVGTLGPTGMKQSYGPGKWTLNEVVCHLADCELTFGYRWRQIASQEHHIIQPFDQDAWATPYAELDAKLALESFSASRAWNLSWLKLLTPAQLEKGVTHPERGELTLHTLMKIAAGHDLNHLAQFKKVATEAGHTL